MNLNHIIFIPKDLAEQSRWLCIQQIKSKEYSAEYEIVCDLLSNENLPPKTIDYWLFKGAWNYGLHTEYCYGPISVNRRLKLLELCVKNNNVSLSSLITLTEKILLSKDYFVEVCYPEDDYYLINDLIDHQELPLELKNQLMKYLKRRKRNEKTNRYCDKDGFAYTINELIDNAQRKGHLKSVNKNLNC